MIQAAAALPPLGRFCALSRSFTVIFDKSGSPINFFLVPTLFLDPGVRFETRAIIVKKKKVCRRATLAGVLARAVLDIPTGLGGHPARSRCVG